MKTGKGLIQLETVTIEKVGCFLIIKSSADKIKLRVSQADLQVFEKSLEQKTAKKIFKELETLFLIREGDSVPNFHTILIKEYNKVKKKALEA